MQFNSKTYRFYGIFVAVIHIQTTHTSYSSWNELLTPLNIEIKYMIHNDHEYVYFTVFTEELTTT